MNRILSFAKAIINEMKARRERKQEYLQLFKKAGITFPHGFPPFNEKDFPLVNDGTGNRTIVPFLFRDGHGGQHLDIVIESQGMRPIGIARTFEYLAKISQDETIPFLLVLGAKRKGSDGKVYVPCFFPVLTERCNHERHAMMVEYDRIVWPHYKVLVVEAPQVATT